MNIERSSSRRSSRTLRPSQTGARRLFPLSLSQVRVFFAWFAAALVLAGLVATASIAGLKPVSTGGTGAVLALASQLRSARLHAAAASGHTPDGRTIMPRRMMHAGAIRSHIASAANVVPISGGVQTYDVTNPPPAFRPLVGYGSATALNNSSTNPPVYLQTLTPTNRTPVWSADETFLIFSSNRTLLGTVNTDATDGSGGSRFHLWAISVNGGEAFQITTSTGPANGGEFFPTLSSNNLAIAFTSDASTPGVQNLYSLPFSYSALTSGIQTATELTASAATPNPPASLTLRGTTEAASSAVTGFDQVQRPTFGPGDGQFIVFSAHSVVPANFSDPNAGHYHLYYLYTSSGGFSPGNNVSYPGKLTNGPADDTDPTYAPDGTYIAFASTANASGFVNNPNNASPDPASNQQDPNASQSLSSGVPAATRSIFLISGGGATGVAFGTVPGPITGTRGRVSLGRAAAFDDYGPAWSSFANQNQYTNPSGNYAYLAFARSRPAASANHDIYYFQMVQGVSQPSTETLTPETAGAGSTNAAILLNTDDNAGQTINSAGGQTTNPANSFDDTYPTWSPFLSVFSISYMSNRTVTYNNPNNGRPIELAASVAAGGTVVNQSDTTANYSVAAGYSGLLVSQVLNLDPPTLLRFSPNEVVHVQAGTFSDPVNGTPNKLAATAGNKITLTVRLSDREAGIDNLNGPNGGPRVYVQIKDPDGKYQDTKNAEHKVFAKDLQYNTQPNQPLNDVTSGIVNAEIGTGFPFFENNASPTDKYSYPSYGTPDFTTPGIANRVYPRGAHGGIYPASTDNQEGTYIFVGKGAAGTTNVVTNPGAPAPITVPGTDPNKFIPLGPEYETQVVNPAFAAGGAADTLPDAQGITVSNPAGIIGDYVSPFWLAGIDDQGAFSGGVYTANTGASALPQAGFGAIKPMGTAGIFPITVTDGVTQTDRPTAGYTDGNNTTHPAEWLQLTKVPVGTDGTQNGDANGGVLYTVTWTTPTSGSDFYVDVVAYDNAAFPAFPAGTSTYSGHKTNWRIYDNVGGFSTNSFTAGNDILVVSDYALGQKFAATTFGGRNLNLNLVPKLFGTESYLTDVDVNTLPDSMFAGIPTTPTSYYFDPAIQALVAPTAGPASQNGLGVGSYYDTIIGDNTFSSDGFPNVQSQRYNIWRILSRGPVPTTVLSSYAPTPISQPGIFDAADPKYAKVPAATLLDAHRCVIWLSPYTGDLLADPGTLDDPGNIGQTGTTNPRTSTTSNLTNFVKSGGRLFITGQDVGSTLTQGGTVSNGPSPVVGSPNFLSDVLNATLVSNGSDLTVMAGTNNRITGNPFYDNTPGLVAIPSYFSLFGPIQTPVIEYPIYPYQDNLVLADRDYGDGSMSQLPSTILPGGASIQGQSDVIAALNGATVAMTYAGGSAAMVYHDDPYLGGTAGLGATATAGQLPNGGTGSRVVYAGFGIEGLTNDYFASASPSSSTNPAYDLLIPQVLPRNPRPAILHNIVNFLRTGRVTGIITQSSGTGQGAGQPIPGVTVYLRPTGAAPSTRVAFSATTASNGDFTISGVEPGTYTLVAIKPGFQRTVTNTGVYFTVEGDTTAQTPAALSMTPEQPGGIAGVVHDPTGAQINGATVTFTSQDNSVKVSTPAPGTINGSVPGNTAENYYIQNVPVTNYTGTAIGPLNPNGLPEYTAAAAPDPPTATGAPDYSQGVVVQPTIITQPVNFTLTPILASIKGTVTNSVTGALIPGATVALYDSTGNTAIAGVTAVTDANGAYTLINVPATTAGTTFTITVSAPGFANKSVTTVPVYLGDTVTQPAIALTPIPPGSIQVVVNYSTGGPVANAVVTYSAPGGTPQTATTDSTGTLIISNVPPATYTVSAIGPNNTTRNVPTTTAAPAQQVVVSSGAQAVATFVVSLIPPSFAGTVSTSATPPAILGSVIITVTDATGAVVATTTTAQNGTYNTGALPPGTYTVTATRAGFATTSTQPTAVQNGDALTGINLVLTAVLPGSITGTVLDNNNAQPVANAVVTFNSTDGTVVGLTATTNSSGVYVIPPPPAAGNVPASTYTGSAVGPNNDLATPEYGAGTTQTITVNPSAATAANFVLPVILASISGTVTDVQTGGAVAGATVTLTGPSGTAVGTPIVTGAGGAYSFTGILATQTLSNYTLTVTAPNYSPGSVTVGLELGDAKTVPVPLNEQAILYGLVTDGSPDAAGQPLAGVTLTVTNAAGTVVATVPAAVITQSATTAGADGQPENYLATLLPGVYTITASKAGFNSQASTSVTLTNTAPKRLNFALVSSIGTIGGLVTNLNDTGLVAGATVTLVPIGATTGVTFTTNGTSTAGPDGSPINYTGQLAQGTYTATVTKGSRTSAPVQVTIRGGTFNRLDFKGANGIPALHQFASGLQFVSTPYDYSALGFNGLFGPLNTAQSGQTPNGNRSNVAVWNPLTGAYALDPTPPADTPRLGVGYWVNLANPTAVTQQGASPTTGFVAVSLGQGWNQIGVPNASAVGIPITHLMFDNGNGGMISYTQASGSQYNLTKYPLYAYSGGAYQALGTGDTLKPWNGYWIYVNAAATLEIPTQ